VHCLRDAATNVLTDLLARQPTTDAKLSFAWQVAAGPAMARASRTSWADGTLRVTPRDAAWQRELQRARPMLAERLARLLGPDVIRSIVILEAVEKAERHPHA